MYNLFPKLGYFSASGLSGVGGSAEIQKTGSPHRKLKSDYKIQLFLSELQMIEIHTYVCLACFPWNIYLPLICPLKFFTTIMVFSRNLQGFGLIIFMFLNQSDLWDLCRSRSHSVGSLLFNVNFSEVCPKPSLWKGPIKSERNWSQ